jgi:membrane-associated protease RseP (regulator of RpoE activity)
MTGYNGKSNCAALGVYVNDYSDDASCTISSLIDQGGAQEAGMQDGDVIKKINEFDISDFSSLHDALSHFQPGDVVTVKYQRGEKNQKARVELKDWAQLPGHEWRARTDCGREPVKEELPLDKAINDIPGKIHTIEPLELQDAMIFPNPTEGLFAFSFRTEPGPIAISITDVNGKVVYHENNDNTTGTYNHDIDLKGLPQGNYIISVSQGDKVFTEQISKQ